MEDEAGNYIFPGLEKGYSLFVYREYGVGESDHKGRNYAVGIASNMGPGDKTRPTGLPAALPSPAVPRSIPPAAARPAPPPAIYF